MQVGSSFLLCAVCVCVCMCVTDLVVVNADLVGTGHRRQSDLLVVLDAAPKPNMLNV